MVFALRFSLYVATLKRHTPNDAMKLHLFSAAMFSQVVDSTSLMVKEITARTFHHEPLLSMFQYH